MSRTENTPPLPIYADKLFVTSTTTNRLARAILEQQQFQQLDAPVYRPLRLVVVSEAIEGRGGVYKGNRIRVRPPSSIGLPEGDLAGDTYLGPASSTPDCIVLNLLEAGMDTHYLAETANLSRPFLGEVIYSTFFPGEEPDPETDYDGEEAPPYPTVREVIVIQGIVLGGC